MVSDCYHFLKCLKWGFQGTLFLFSKSLTTLKKFQIDEAKVCLSVGLSVCVSLASDSSEAIEVIVVKLDTVTASDMALHHVLIILTLTFTQNHTDLNHKINQWSIISEIILFKQSPSRCENSPNIGLYNVFSVRCPCSSLKITTASQTWQMLTLNYIYYSRSVFKLWHANLCMVHLLVLVTMTKVTVGRQRQTFSVELFRQVNKQQALNLLLWLWNRYMAWPSCFCFPPSFFFIAGVEGSKEME